MNKLPIYDITLSENDHGVGMISLVTDPAIGVDWIKLSATNLNFKADKDKQMLWGPFLIPNMLIYRSDDKMGEYYVRFSKEEIEKISTKFNEDLNNKNINFQHTDQKVEAFVSQNWVIESEQDKSTSLGFELPEGTWFGGVKIKDESFWIEKVKTDEVKGFSVEILADLELALKNNKNEMSKEIKMASAALVNGDLVYFDGELAIGSALFSDEAMTIPVVDSNWEVEGGLVVVTVDGLVTEIIEPAPVEEVEEASSDLEVIPNITSEEVSSMIDNRFGEIMEEITRMKVLIEGLTGEMTGFKSEVGEKFSLTAAAQSIKKVEVRNVDDKFSKVEARIRDFAKNK